MSALRVSFVIAVPAMVSLRCNVLNPNPNQLPRAIDPYASTMAVPMVMVMIWVIVVMVIAGVAPPRIVVGVSIAVGVAVIAVVAMDDSHGAILDGGEHMISHALANAGLLEAIDVVCGQDINDGRGAEILENRRFADLVAAKFFNVGNGQHFAIEHFLFEDRGNAAVLDFLAGILAIRGEENRLREWRNF